MARRKQTSALPNFGSCFVKRAKRTSRSPEPLSLRRYGRWPEIIPARVAQLPFSASVMRAGSLLPSTSKSAALYSCLQYLLSGDLEIPVLIMPLLVFACWRNVVASRPETPLLVACDDA